MQSPLDDKLAYSYPCQPTENCIDYDDYDPCESNEDITEKDLAILLKEEAAKLAKEKEKEKEIEKEKVKAAEGNDLVESEKKVDGQQQKAQKQPTQANAAVADAAETEFFKDGEGETLVKKKTCKYIKNPFFTNRLRLSTSHLPMPPPGPPPQNLPLAEDETSATKICPRRKKKCKKVEEKSKQPNQVKKAESKGKDVKIDDEKTLEKDVEECEDDDGDEEEEMDEDGTDEEEGVKNGSLVQGMVVHSRKKKREPVKICKKEIVEKPPCRKKESEVSVNFGPRKIPLQQKDLPQKSPKAIPEVEKQILMACGKSEEVNCKKRCKKKADKVK